MHAGRECSTSSVYVTIARVNYRHAYHAGNFSDVFKHLVLLSLIESLQKKQTPFCYLETHAGHGLYDLTSREADKTKEYQNGIGKILDEKNLPPFVARYLNWVKSLNNPNAITVFPGTALLAQAHLRPNDRLILSELHPEEYQMLKKLFQNHKQIALHAMDGYLALKAFLPPKEKRGIVLIDPPYESLNEIELLKQGLVGTLKKWPSGIYAIWYPIKDKPYKQQIKNVFDLLAVKNVLNLELMVSPSLPLSFRGCGMWIINPPWQFYRRISSWFRWIKKVL